MTTLVFRWSDIVLYCSCLAVFLACKSSTAEYTHLEGNAQGTTFSIVYFDPQQRDYSQQVDSLFRVIDHSMSLWDSTSLISRINRNEAGVIPDDHFIRVFNRAQEIAEKTDGKFDVTVGPLVRAWGFYHKLKGPLPDSVMIDSLEKFIGFRKVSLSDHTLLKADQRLQLDFNAIAQGYTVDVMSQWLESHGIEDYLVEIGGEVRTRGKSTRGDDWQIGIDKPVENSSENRPLQTTVALSGKSLATSGSYRKFIEQGGKKLPHIIDPTSGYPVAHKLVSISVLADDCMTADGYATACLVIGLDSALQLAKRERLELYGIYLDEHDSLQVKATDGFPK